jgi:hypothetical protein
MYMMAAGLVESLAAIVAYYARWWYRRELDVRRSGCWS